MRYFLLFLLTHVLFTAYGAYVNYIILQHIFHRNQLYTIQSLPLLQLFQFFLYWFPVPIGLFLLCFVISLFLFFFLVHHTYLIAINETTNERQKYHLYRQGFNLMLPYQMMELQGRIEETQGKLKSIQARILEVKPELANQHPERSKELGVAVAVAVGENATAAKGKSASEEAAAQDSSELKQLFADQASLIQLLKQFLAHQKYLNECDDSLYEKRDPPPRPDFLGPLTEYERVYHDRQHTVRQRQKVQQRNIYHRGFWANLNEVLWPSLEPRVPDNIKKILEENQKKNQGKQGDRSASESESEGSAAIRQRKGVKDSQAQGQSKQQKKKNK